METNYKARMQDLITDLKLLLVDRECDLECPCCDNNLAVFDELMSLVNNEEQILDRETGHE